ncbi:MAG TPA: Ig-like domain-containing protein, partial [Methanomassiliicoccales archaeon]|nr:Ig-like domain-containing protein [Methanomassiliicoccales archaeon]
VPDVLFVWEGFDSLSGIAEYQYQVDGGNFTTLGDWSVTSATITLSDGNHVVTIIAIDNATNMATDSVSVLIDAFPPILVISSPVNGSIYATNGVTLYWNATDEEGFVASVFANIDAEAAVNVTGLNSWAFTGIADGKHMFTVTATDNAGNVAVKTTNFTVDATAPVIQITSPSANAFISANAVTVTWTVDASVSGLNGTDVRLVNATFDSYWIWVGNATSYEFTGLHDSVYTVYVMSGDMAGNSANVSRSFTIDTIAPVVTISSPTMGQMFNTTTVTIFWNATDANAPLKYYYKEGSGTSWNFTMNNHVQLALSNGSHIVTVRAMDPADNIGSASVTFVADADKPTVVISTPASGMLTNISTVKVFWNATDPTTAINRTEYSIDGGAFVKFNGTGPFNATFVGLADGLHTVVIVAYDAVENHNSSTVTFTVDTTAPTISAKSPTGTDKNLNVDITVTFSEQMNKASVSIVGVTVGSPVWATNNKTVTWHASGLAYSTNYTLTVSGKDLAGNLLGGTKTIVFSTKVQVIGFIKDANGNPVANATLELTMPSMPDMPAVWANTSADGSFAIVLPMGGDYQVKITKSGFDTTTKSATFGPGLAGNNLGTVAINQTADYTIPIVVVVIVVLAAILGYLFFVRGKKPKK